MADAPDGLTRIFVAYLGQRPALMAQVISAADFDVLLRAFLIATPKQLAKIRKALEMVERRNR